MAAALIALAKRCEAAAGPDRELDADIALTQGWAQLRGDNWCGPTGGICVPAYTASLDAAKTLVPEDALWKAQHTINIGDDETFECPKGEPPKDFKAGVGIGNVPMHWEHGRSFCSAALALCAAALRARAA